MKEEGMSRRSKSLLLLGAAILPGLVAVMSGPAASASSQSPARASASCDAVAEINGSGSTWAQNAVDQWISNVTQQGLQVVFTGDGSAAGRTDFALGTVDFAVSDIGYQGFDPVTDTNDSSNRPYAYLPVTAGGTSFPYNLVVNGKRITNLRLSGNTLAEIFTGHITNWDDPAIAADNNHKISLPNLPITTVVPSEGSGTTAQFTAYLSDLFPQYWVPFNGGHSGMTEYWPQQGAHQVAQTGSAQIMNYIASGAANGSIGIDEYSYPLQAGFPVAQLENKAGYYVLPSEYNVAVALTKAIINYNKSSKNYLLENLDDVYINSDPRTYPLSSYSYTIIPTSSSDELMANSGSPGCPAKAQALARFLNYSICQGQEYIGPIGYSALPVNLAEAGFQQIEKIKAAAPQVSIASLNIRNCNNPTFDSSDLSLNLLAQEAPQPPSCDKAGQGPCTGILNANANGGQGSSTAKGGGSTSSSGSSSASSSASPSTSSGSSSSSPGTGTTGTNSTTSSGTDNPGGTSNVADTATNLPAAQDNGLSDWVLGAIVVFLLLAILIIPPVVSRGMSGRGRL
jgi:phosphate transport system substrate-binding protein